MSTVKPPKGRPGRRPGSGYPTDAALLDMMADVLVRNPRMSVRAAIIATGHDGEADIRRLQRHFKAKRAQLVRAAELRASPPSSQTTSRPAPVDLARIADPVAAVGRHHFGGALHDAMRKAMGIDAAALGRTAALLEQMRLATVPLHRSPLDEVIRKAMAPHSLIAMDKVVRQLREIAHPPYVSQMQKIVSEMNRPLSTYQKMFSDFDRLMRSPLAHLAAADKMAALVGKRPK